MGNRGKNFNNNALIWAIVLFAAIGSLGRAFADKTITGDLTVTGGDISTPAAMNFKPSGDTDDYLSHTTQANIATTTIIGGDFWQILSSGGEPMIAIGGILKFRLQWDGLVGEMSSFGGLTLSTLLSNGDITLSPDGTGEVIIESVLDMTDHAIKAIGYLAFDLDGVPPGNEGDTGWNDTFKTLDLHAGDGPVLQVGHETVARGFNDLGTTIIDGTVLFPIGSQGVFIKGGRAKADTHVTISGPLVMATQDIADQADGRVTIFGNVTDVDISPFSNGITFALGDTLFVDPDFEGEFTNVRPAFPDYEMRIGRILAVSGSTVTVAFAQSSRVTDTLQNFWNGAFRESFDFRVTEAGGTVTGKLRPTNGHDDMTMMFSDGFTMLPTDAGEAEIDLTSFVSADTTVAEVFVYILESAKTVMAASNSGWPTAEHIRVAQLGLQTAALTGTNGALRNQNVNEHLEDTNTLQGHITHIGARIRAMQAEWDNGTEATLDAGGQFISVSAGDVFQMHLQSFPAQVMPSDDIHVPNDPDTPNVTITNLDSILKDSTGAALSNAKFYSLVVWIVCNKTGETSHVMLNLPSGSYNSEAGAMSDSLGFANYTIPVEFKGVGALSARFVLRFDNPGWTYSGVTDGYQDLRGFIPNSTAGSGAGSSGITTFLGLTDTPVSHTALQVLQANAGGTATEYTNTPTATATNITGVSDITGLGTQVQDLDMGFFDIVNPDNMDAGVDPSAITDVDATPHAHWQFEDSSGNGTLAVAEGGALLVNAAGTTAYCDRGMRLESSIPIASKGLFFDGSTWFDSTGYNGVVGTAARSVSVWFKSADLGTRRVIVEWGNSGAGNGVRWGIWLETDGSIFISGKGSSAASSLTDLDDDKWHHLGITVGAGENFADIHFYLDGVLDGSSTGSAVAINTGNTLAVSVGDRVDSASSPFNGCIDELAIFDSEISLANISNICSRQRERFTGDASNGSTDWTNADSDFKTNGIGEFGSGIGLFGTTPPAQAAAMTTPQTNLGVSGPSTPDFSPAVTNSSPYGLTTADEFETVLEVIFNLQIRVNELEAMLDSSTGIGVAN